MTADDLRDAARESGRVPMGAPRPAGRKSGRGAGCATIPAFGPRVTLPKIADPVGE